MTGGKTTWSQPGQPGIAGTGAKLIMPI